MTIRTRRRSGAWLPAAAVALAFAGCATTGPYSEVTGEGLAQQTANEEDVLVLGVDGRLILSGTKTERVEPGQRLMLLGTVRQDRRSRGSSTTVPLNVKPCMRYYFVAAHENMTTVHPWQLVLKKVEPIEGCVAEPPAAKPAG